MRPVCETRPYFLKLPHLKLKGQFIFLSGQIIIIIIIIIMKVQIFHVVSQLIYVHKTACIIRSLRWSIAYPSTGSCCHCGNMTRLTAVWGVCIYKLSFERQAKTGRTGLLMKLIPLLQGWAYFMINKWNELNK